MRARIKSVTDMAVIMAVVAFLYGCLLEPAMSATVCRQRVCAPVHRVHHAVVKHAIAYQPAVQYFVGAPIRQQAQETYQHKLDGSYQALVEEVREHRAFREGLEIGRSLPQPTPAEEHGDKLGANEPVGQPEPPETPSEPNGDKFAERYPTLAAKCLKCHTGDEPKGGRFIDGTDPFDADEQVAMAVAIATGEMPKGKPLSPQERLNAYDELFAE